MIGRYSSTTASSAVCATFAAEAETKPSPARRRFRTLFSSRGDLEWTHTT